MGCCGQRRGLVMTGRTATDAARRSQPISKVALYEYTGTVGMTVTAPISGAKYRFATRGAKVQVDLRDVGSLAGLPNLRRLE
jgi:hypothetical protein